MGSAISISRRSAAILVAIAILCAAHVTAAQVFTAPAHKSPSVITAGAPAHIAAGCTARGKVHAYAPVSVPGDSVIVPAPDTGFRIPPQPPRRISAELVSSEGGIRGPPTPIL